MKITYRIPTKEQFAFVEVVEEGVVTDEVIQSRYNDLTNSFKEGLGLPDKVFNALLDEYLTTGTVQNGGDVWEQLSEKQKFVVNEVKKSRKRTSKDQYKD